MLMGGKGRRLSDITNFKPFLLVNNKPIFKLVFDNLNSKEKVIITNNIESNTYLTSSTGNIDQYNLIHQLTCQSFW